MAQNASNSIAGTRNKQLPLPIPQSQEKVLLHPILNLENMERIKSSLTMHGRTMTPDSLIQYFNFTGCNIDPDKLELVVNEAKDIYTRYSEYRSNPEEYVYIPQSMSEFEGLRSAEQMYGGGAFALSIHDMIRIIEEGGEDENVLHSCIRKDSIYLTSYIKSLEANSLGSTLPQCVYGFYKCSNKHSHLFETRRPKEQLTSQNN